MLQKKLLNSFLFILAVCFIDICTPKMAIAAPLCSVLFKNWGAESSHFGTAILQDLPILKKGVETILTSSLTSSKVKRLILNTLANPKVKVIKLTPDIVSMIRFPPYFDCARAYKESIQTFSSSGERTLNEEAGESVNWSLIPSGHIIYIRDMPDQLPGLIHEMAHIKFDEFLEKNLNQLSLVFPETLLKKTNGFYTINQQLYDYLTERYAHEVEFETYLALGLDPADTKFAGMTIQNYKPSISILVREVYNIDESSLSELIGHNLRTILSGSLFD